MLKYAGSLRRQVTAEFSGGFWFVRRKQSSRFWIGNGKLFTPRHPGNLSVVTNQPLNKYLQTPKNPK